MSSSGFCNQAHQQSYQEEQESLGLARLIEAKPTPPPPPRAKVRREPEPEMESAVPPAAPFLLQVPQTLQGTRRCRDSAAPTSIAVTLAHSHAEISFKKLKLPTGSSQVPVFESSVVETPAVAQMAAPVEFAFEAPISVGSATMLTVQRPMLPKSQPVSYSTETDATVPYIRDFALEPSLVATDLAFPVSSNLLRALPVGGLLATRFWPLAFPDADSAFQIPRVLAERCNVPPLIALPEIQIAPDSSAIENKPVQPPATAGFVPLSTVSKPESVLRSFAELQIEPAIGFPEFQPPKPELVLPKARMVIWDQPHADAERVARDVAQPVPTAVTVQFPAAASSSIFGLSACPSFQRLASEATSDHALQAVELPEPELYAPVLAHPTSRSVAAAARLLADQETRDIAGGSASFAEGSRPQQSKPPAWKRVNTVIQMADITLGTSPSLLSHSGPALSETPESIIVDQPRPLAREADPRWSLEQLTLPQVEELAAEITFQEPAAPAADLVKANYGVPVPKEVGSTLRDIRLPQHVPLKPLVPPSKLSIAKGELPKPPKPPSEPIWKKAVGPLVNAGRALPRQARWFVAGLPLIGFLVFTAGTQASRSQSGFSAGFSNQWQNIQGGIAQRAAVSLREDFRAGLRDWTGNGQWTGSWTFDRTGFVRPGRLALYKPSIPLANYQFEFATSIEQGGIGWVCRARDPRNYQAVKLTVGGGDSPSAALVRYRVVNGKSGSRTRTPFPLLGRNSMQSVRMDVQGTEFAVYVEGQLIDHWTAPDPADGGIGFFADSGDRARLAWVAISHQYDLIGRLCALIAP